MGMSLASPTNTRGGGAMKTASLAEVARFRTILKKQFPDMDPARIEALIHSSAKRSSQADKPAVSPVREYLVDPKSNKFPQRQKSARGKRRSFKLTTGQSNIPVSL
jgi:hypothetical protein